jgi:hypothetical protein
MLLAGIVEVGTGAAEAVIFIAGGGKNGGMGQWVCRVR